LSLSLLGVENAHRLHGPSQVSSQEREENVEEMPWT
jgi:hypothetical protein